MDNKNKELTCNSCKRFRDNMLNDICDAGQWTRMLNPSTCQYFSSKKTTNEKTKPMIKFKKEVNEMDDLIFEYEQKNVDNLSHSYKYEATIKFSLIGITENLICDKCKKTIGFILIQRSKENYNYKWNFCWNCRNEILEPYDKFINKQLKRTEKHFEDEKKEKLNKIKVKKDKLYEEIDNIESFLNKMEKSTKEKEKKDLNLKIKYCEHCGSKIKRDPFFCHICGAKITRGE